MIIFFIFLFASLNRICDNDQGCYFRDFVHSFIYTENKSINKNMLLTSFCDYNMCQKIKSIIVARVKNKRWQMFSIIFPRFYRLCVATTIRTRLLFEHNMKVTMESKKHGWMGIKLTLGFHTIITFMSTKLCPWYTCMYSDHWKS